MSSQLLPLLGYKRSQGQDIKRLQEAAGGWSSPVMPLRYVEVGQVVNESVKLA